MDFRQTVQPNARPSSTSTSPATPAHDTERQHSAGGANAYDVGLNRWMRVFTVVLLVGITVLLAALALGFGRGSHNSEAKYVDSKKYQAVFLNNGQVYFGNVQGVNDQYLRMTNIYYLTQANGSSNSSSNSSSSNNYSLVKLGCQQIHDPEDAMVINRSEISFWENLSDSGKVVSSIKEFKKQNPNGPDCSQVSSQTQASSTATQGSGSTTGTSTTSGTSDSTTQK